ncbi:MAG TPA: hypothetical protein VF519_04800 [Mycobacteriales bacterium]|jgi:hypothetical protein
MRRLLLAGAIVASAASFHAPAQALGCPEGTRPATLPTGTTYCTPVVYCDPGPCGGNVKRILEDAVACPTDIPVWSPTCRSIFGD